MNSKLCFQVRSPDGWSAPECVVSRGTHHEKQLMAQWTRHYGSANIRFLRGGRIVKAPCACGGKSPCRCQGRTKGIAELIRELLAFLQSIRDAASAPTDNTAAPRTSRGRGPGENDLSDFEDGDEEEEFAVSRYMARAAGLLAQIRQALPAPSRFALLVRQAQATAATIAADRSRRRAATAQRAHSSLCASLIHGTWRGTFSADPLRRL